MNPRIATAFVTLFAGLLLVVGIALTFFPEEIGTSLWGPGTPAIVMALLGAAVLGLGMLNWFSRRAPIGGIYGRPVLLANLVHFVVGGMALLRQCLAGGATPWIWMVTMVYLAGMAFYGLLMFVGPVPRRGEAA